MANKESLNSFVSLSTLLTGFEAHRLLGTGQTALYLETLETHAGSENTRALLDAWTNHIAGAEDVDRALRHHVLGDPRLGPIARHLIKLWFVGCWRQLPQDWRDRYGEGLPDGDVVPSPGSYTEGLLWPTVGANPPGAKPFGYGMWATPPRVTLD